MRSRWVSYDGALIRFDYFPFSRLALRVLLVKSVDHLHNEVWLYCIMPR